MTSIEKNTRLSDSGFFPGLNFYSSKRKGFCGNSWLRSSENYEAKLVSEDRLEFNDGDVWLKAPKVASAPRKRKVVEDRGGKKFRVFLLEDLIFPCVI